ncbi:MAG: DUF3298 domain-containing protein [Prevotella sp.]|nr:DUF3298 domain-containing protein [Prevotella sp.]
MKAKSIIIALATALTTACGNNTASNNDFTTDSIAFSEKTKTAEVIVQADFPKSGNLTTTNIIREYINEELGGTYGGNITESDSMLAYYGKAQMAELEKLSAEFETESAVSMYSSRHVSKIYETNQYITYISSFESYTGGAHGMHGATYTTFRKSDGRRFGNEMLTRRDTEEFRALIKDGLKRYFAEDEGKEISDDELKEMLLTNSGVDYLPLPQYPPCLTEKGMMFVYQPYEIAPYAAGMPHFTVPYDKIKPFLTVTAIKLIDGKTENE